MKEVTAYKCDYCHRCFGRKVDAANHERSCSSNPKRRNCKTCLHSYNKAWEEPDESNLEMASHFLVDEENAPRAAGGPWCGIYDMSISDKPYMEECDYSDGYGYGQPAPIPGSCPNYNYKGYAGYRRKENA